MNKKKKNTFIKIVILKRIIPYNRILYFIIIYIYIYIYTSYKVMIVLDNFRIKKLNINWILLI